MHKIKKYVEDIEEELEDAKKYAEMYVEMKVKNNQAAAQKLKEMGSDELKHASYIHEWAVKDIEEISKVYTPPVDMLEKWEKAHKTYVEEAALVRQMLSM
jgi:hypothetical protein